MIKLQDMEKKDRMYTEGLLARYGLQGEKHMRGGLIVHPNQPIQLSQTTQDDGNHLVLKTQDLDQLKFWIGVPDAVYESREYSLPIPEQLDLDFNDCCCQLNVQQWKAVKRAARCYIWGPSHKVSHLKENIEKALGTVESTIHIYTTLDIHSVLSFSKEEKSVILLANTINFYPGGQIDSRGNSIVIQAQKVNYLQG